MLSCFVIYHLCVVCNFYNVVILVLGCFDIIFLLIKGTRGEKRRACEFCDYLETLKAAWQPSPTSDWSVSRCFDHVMLKMAASTGGKDGKLDVFLRVSVSLMRQLCTRSGFLTCKGNSESVRQQAAEKRSKCLVCNDAEEPAASRLC